MTTQPRTGLDVAMIIAEELGRNAATWGEQATRLDRITSAVEAARVPHNPADVGVYGNVVRAYQEMRDHIARLTRDGAVRMVEVQQGLEQAAGAHATANYDAQQRLRQLLPR